MWLFLAAVLGLPTRENETCPVGASAAVPLLCFEPAARLVGLSLWLQNTNWIPGVWEPWTPTWGLLVRTYSMVLAWRTSLPSPPPQKPPPPQKTISNPPEQPARSRHYSGQLGMDTATLHQQQGRVGTGFPDSRPEKHLRVSPLGSAKILRIHTYNRDLEIPAPRRMGMGVMGMG
jgi:hypothetical protein